MTRAGLLLLAAATFTLVAGCSGGEKGGTTPPPPPPNVGTIAGRVTDASTGQAVAGATISTQPATQSAVTSATGDFTISNVAPGSYTVSAERSGFNTQSVSVAVSAGQTTSANVSLTPRPMTGVISGRITDAQTGNPLAGATVTTQPATAAQVSDAQGNFTIPNVQPGTYSVTATRTGYTAQTTPNVTVSAGQTAVANVALAMLINYDGYWAGTTSQGRPVSIRVVNNALTSFSIGYAVSGSCTATGGVSIIFTTPRPLNNGSFTLTATGAPPNALSYNITGTFASATSASGSANFTLVTSNPLPPCSATGSGTWTVAPAQLPGILRGKVTDAATGQPIANASVTTTPATSTVTTNAQGDYTINDVPPGNYVVAASRSGYQSQSAPASVSSEQTTTVNLALTPVPTTGAISGRVTDASNGQPVAGASVSTVPATLGAVTDAQGNYSIPNVPAGAYSVTAAKSGYSAQQLTANVVAGSTSTLNFSLAPQPTTGSIAGTITDASTGQPLSGVAVSTTPATQAVTTNAQGQYSIPSVPPGTYAVTASRTGYTAQTANGVVVTAGQSATRNFALAQAANYDGSWSGTTSQGKTISFTIVNNAFTTFSIGWAASGTCSSSGTISISYSTPRPITGNGFTISQTGVPPSALSFTVNGTFNSNTTASGTANFTLNQSFPLPPCSATGSATWTATRP